MEKRGLGKLNENAPLRKCGAGGFMSRFNDKPNFVADDHHSGPDVAAGILPPHIFCGGLHQVGFFIHPDCSGERGVASVSLTFRV